MFESYRILIIYIHKSAFLPWAIHCLVVNQDIDDYPIRKLASFAEY